MAFFNQAMRLVAISQTRIYSRHSQGAHMILRAGFQRPQNIARFGRPAYQRVCVAELARNPGISFHQIAGPFAFGDALLIGRRPAHVNQAQLLMENAGTGIKLQRLLQLCDGIIVSPQVIKHLTDKARHRG